MSSSFTPEERRRAEEIKRALGTPSSPTNPAETILHDRPDWAAIKFGLVSVAVVALGLFLVIRRPSAQAEPSVTAPPAPVIPIPSAPQLVSTPRPHQEVVRTVVPQPVAQPIKSSPAPIRRTAPVSAAPVRSQVQSVAPASAPSIPAPNTSASRVNTPDTTFATNINLARDTWRSVR